MGVTARAPAATAVPVTATARFEFAAVETMARLPVTVPVEVGAKVTWKLELWPPPRVRGTARPLIRMPEPVALACEMVALVLPEFVTVTLWLCVLPTVTLPNATVAGLMPICPAVVPSPATGKDALTGSADGELEDPTTAPTVRAALPVTVILLLMDPDDFGAKVTVNAEL